MQAGQPQQAPVTLDTGAIEKAYNSGQLTPDESAAWERMRNNVPIKAPKGIDDDTFYGVLENKVNKGTASLRELKTVKEAALNGQYVPKVVTFHGADGQTAIPGYARSNSDSFLGDLGYQAQGALLGAGKAVNSTIDELTGNQADETANKKADEALTASRPSSSLAGQVGAEIGMTATPGMAARGLAAGVGRLGVQAAKLSPVLQGAGNVLSNPYTQAAEMGATAPTNDGQSRLVNTALSVGAQGLIGKAVPMAIGLGRGAMNTGKAALGMDTPVTEFGDQALAASTAAGELGIPMNPADAMKIGGNPRQMMYLASDMGNKELGQEQVQATQEAAQNLGNRLKQTNADTKFDNVDDLTQLAGSGNPHAAEAQRAQQSMLNSQQTGDWRDQVQANMQGQLALRKGQYADAARQVQSQASQSDHQLSTLPNAVDDVLGNLQKNKLNPNTDLISQLSDLKSNLGASVDPATGRPVQNLASLMDSAQAFKQKLYGLQANNVISSQDMATLKPIENAYNSEIQDGLKNISPDLQNKFNTNQQFYANNVAPFSDQTLSDAIKSFGSNRSTGALTKSVQDADRFKLLQPLMGDKGQAAMASGVFNDGLDNVMERAGRVDAFNLNDFKRMLNDTHDTLQNVVQDQPTADMLDGIRKTVNFIAPGNTVLGSAARRTNMLGASELATEAVLGGGAKEGGSGLLAKGAAGAIALTQAIKQMSQNPDLRNKFIRMSNLPPSSELATIYKKQLGNAMGLYTNAYMDK